MCLSEEFAALINVGELTKLSSNIFQTKLWTTMLGE